MAVLASPFELPLGRLLALDLGQARIGVAVCDERGVLATPLTVLYRCRTRAEDFAALRALVVKEKAVGVLVGLPVDGEGKEGAQARWARRYASRLAGVLSVPLAFWDETLSSVDAMHLMAEGQGHAPADAVAAAVILTDFLEARRARNSGQGLVEREQER